MSWPLRKIKGIEYVLAFSVFVAVSLLNEWLQGWIGYQAIALVYLLAVVLLALFVGRGAIVFGTALTALGWSFMFAPPRYSFHIGSFYDKMMFAMYFVVALTVAQLTAQLRAERLAEQKREERSSAMYLFTRVLADAADRADILERVVTHVGRVFGADVALLLSEELRGSLNLVSTSTWQLDKAQRAEAQRASELNQFLKSEAVPAAAGAACYLPLTAGSGPIGVLGLRLKSGADLIPDQRELLENFARQTALVLDRQRLRDAETTGKLLVESERLGRTLLNSVSHELRTPLAAIATAAATLRDSGGLNPLQQKLSAEIDSATTRLNRVVQSLLSAARVQSGQVRPHLDWCDLTDVVRASLRELGPVLSAHRLEKRLDPGMPLIRADFTLLQQALANLLVNAATYTPEGTLVELSSRQEGKELVLAVQDHGPGLAPDQIERIFEPFHRPPASKPGGTGLGLAIVKGFIEAQGGRVEVRNRAEGGAEFCIRMPMEEAPRITEETA